MRILIVDDSDLVRRAIRDLVTTDTDWVVCGEACNSDEAIDQAQVQRPDLVLLDIHMPGTDGLKTARLLRTSLPETKIILMSQNDPGVLGVAAVGAGADGCMDKLRFSTDAIRLIVDGKR